jgi:hypothetical protein
VVPGTADSIGLYLCAAAATGSFCPIISESEYKRVQQRRRTSVFKELKLVP